MNTYERNRIVEQARRRRVLLQTPDGYQWPAIVTDARRAHATVTAIDLNLSCEVAWPTVVQCISTGYPVEWRP